MTRFPSVVWSNSHTTFMLLALVTFLPSVSYSKENRLSATVDYGKHISPIFTQHCTSCHGGVKQAADLSYAYPEHCEPAACDPRYTSQNAGYVLWDVIAILPHSFYGWLEVVPSQDFYYGETDEFGYRAAVHPVHVRDFHATMLRMLGIDHKKHSFQGLHQKLTGVKPAQVIEELIA